MEETAIQIQHTQALDTKDYNKQLKELRAFIKAGMHEGQFSKGADYGLMPGTKNKIIFDKGAEKLAKKFNIAYKAKRTDKVLDIANQFYYIQYRVDFTHITTGKYLGSSIGSCNSKESFFIASRKPFFDTMNTVDQKAYKRAFVKGIRKITLAGELFSEFDDEEDLDNVIPKEDPERLSITGRFFMIGAERGFTSELLHSQAKKKFNVDSFNDVSTDAIEQLTEEMIKLFEVVGKGNKPKKILKDTGPKEDVHDDADKNMHQDAEEPKEDIQEAELVEPIHIPCYNCKNKEAINDTFFCSKECEEEYKNTKAAQPRSEVTKRMDKFVKTGEIN